MNLPGVNQYRVNRACTWAADGINVTPFTPGEIITDHDARVNATFIQYAQEVNWITRIEPTAAPRTTAMHAPETRVEELTEEEPVPPTRRRRRA